MRVRVSEHVRREDELWVDRLTDETHPALVRQAVALLQIAAQAGRHHVCPPGVAPPGPRQDVIHREPLAATIAVLAGVPVAAQDVFLVERDAIEKRLSDVDGEADHRRQRERARGRSNDAWRAFDGLGLASEE